MLWQPCGAQVATRFSGSIDSEDAVPTFAALELAASGHCSARPPLVRIGILQDGGWGDTNKERNRMRWHGSLQELLLCRSKQQTSHGTDSRLTVSVFAVLEHTRKECSPPAKAYDGLMRCTSGCTNQSMEVNCKGTSLLFLNKLVDNSSHRMFPKESLLLPRPASWQQKAMAPFSSFPLRATRGMEHRSSGLFGRVAFFQHLATMHQDVDANTCKSVLRNPFEFRGS